MLKKLQKWEGKGQRAALPAIPGFIIIYFLSKDQGGKSSPITPRIQRAQPGVKSKASAMAMADGTERERRRERERERAGGLRPRPPRRPRS